LENDFRITLGTKIYFGHAKVKSKSYYINSPDDEYNETITNLGLLINLRYKKTYLEFAAHVQGYKNVNNIFYASDLLFGFSLGYIMF